MYKRRLAKWGMRKNCHLDDLQRLTQLDRHQSTTNEIVPEIPDASRPNHAKLLRYARRKCRAFQKGTQDVDLKHVSNVRSTLLAPPRSITGQDAASRVEYICWVLHAYIDGESAAHQSTHATWRQEAGNTKVLAIFQNIVPATQHFLAGQHGEGAEHLSRFYNGARCILEACPVLLTRDVLAMTMFLNSAVPEVPRQIVRYFRDLSRIVYAPSHPLSILLSWVSDNAAALSASTSEESACSAGSAALITILHSYCLQMVGFDHTDTADCETLLNLWQHDQVSSLQDLLGRYDAHFGLGSYQSLHCLSHIQTVFVARRDRRGLTAVLTDLSRRPPHLSAAGGRRLAQYVHTCRDVLERQHQLHPAVCWQDEQAMWMEIERLRMGLSNTLAADEWKVPTLNTQYSSRTQKRPHS